MPAKIGPKKRFVHYIVEHREALELTQEQLADRIGTTHMTVSRWENYKTRVDFPILAAVAEALWGDSERAEDLLHHPDRPTPNQLMRQLPDDDQKHFYKQLKNAARSA